MNQDLQTLLLQDNPWLAAPERLQEWLRRRIPAHFLPRTSLGPAAERWGEPHRAHLVVGPRRAGKSTALWAYLAERGEPVLLVDCEQPLVREWCRSAPLFLADLEELAGEPITLLFEEIQHLEEAGLFLKGLVDRRYPAPILVTGSSSYHLGARTRESLAGRATRSRLLPFSLAEVTQDAAGRPPLVRAHLVQEALHRHLVYGGYPEVWLSTEPELLLTELLEAIVLRDASDLHRIARPDAFRGLLHLAARQSGSLVNLSEWAGILGASRPTVAAYLEILEAGHVLARLTPFTGGRRHELTSRPKPFFLDVGLRNRLLGDFRPLPDRIDRGPLLESWVLTELWKALPPEATLHFWRSTSGAEVDFVVRRGEDVLGIEVKALELRRPRLARSSRSFLQAYRPDRFLVVNLGLEHRERVEGIEVEWIRPERVTLSIG